VQIGSSLSYGPTAFQCSLYSYCFALGCELSIQSPYTRIIFYTIGLLLFPEDGGSMFLRNVGKDLQNYSSPHTEVITARASNPTKAKRTSKHYTTTVTGASVMCTLESG
jgi:hypothetical protein